MNKDEDNRFHGPPPAGKVCPPFAAENPCRGRAQSGEIKL